MSPSPSRPSRPNRPTPPQIRRPSRWIHHLRWPLNRFTTRLIRQRKYVGSLDRFTTRDFQHRKYAPDSRFTTRVIQHREYVIPLDVPLNKFIITIILRFQQFTQPHRNSLMCPSITLTNRQTPIGVERQSCTATVSIRRLLQYPPKYVCFFLSLFSNTDSLAVALRVSTACVTR
jgi:hypothetical protein